MAKRIQNATLEGSMLGVRAIENHVRKPYGAGWALTGDAAYVKDPVTAYGVGDAMLQGFWLAKSLDEYFAGRPWDDVMAAYQERRDTSFRALYDQTTNAVSLQDDAHALAELRAVLINQHDVRILLQAMPRFLDEAFDPMDRFRHALLKAAFESVARD